MDAKFGKKINKKKWLFICIFASFYIFLCIKDLVRILENKLLRYL